MTGHTLQCNSRVEANTNRSSEVSPRLRMQVPCSSTSPRSVPTPHRPVGVQPLHATDIHVDTSQQSPRSIPLQPPGNLHNGWAIANDANSYNGFVHQFWANQALLEQESQNALSPHSINAPSLSRKGRGCSQPSKISLDKCENMGSNTLLQLPSPARSRNTWIKKQIISISAAGFDVYH